MSATTSRTRPQSRSGSAPGSRPGARPRPRRPPEPVRLIGPGRNALEGAAAVLCAVAAMTVVSAGALGLLHAGSVGSLWSLTATVTAMAVGGSVTGGSSTSGGAGATGGLDSLLGGTGGGLGPSLSATADGVPLTVTLVGAVALWIAFSRRLRRANRVRFTAGELAVRAAGAGAAAFVLFLILAGLAHGSAVLPESTTSRLAGVGGNANSTGLGSFLGGGGMSARPVLTYRVNAMSAGFGAVLWVAVALGVGFLISRRARLPLGGTLDGLRSGWGRSLSAIVRTGLVCAAVPLVCLVFVGAAVGGRVGTAAGAALLLVPNALAVFGTLGVGASWTAAMHPVRHESSSPLASLLGGLGGADAGQRPDRVEHLRSWSVGGLPLWLALLVITGLVLLGCAWRAARATKAAHRKPLHDYRGPLAQHLGMAERFGVLTAVVLGAAVWAAGLSGRFGISLFGSEMGGTHAEFRCGVLWPVVFGLLLGSLTGLGGSLLCAELQRRGR